MCGRFSLVVPERFFSKIFTFKDLPEMQPHYNIPPGVDIWAVRGDPGRGKSEVVRLRWGLVPFWSKDPKLGHRMINARSETVMEKPAFKAAFKNRRCLIPADGFYEWKRVGSRKLPFHIRMKSGDPFAMAGLWESWKGPQDERLESCTILTTGPNALVADIHHRMPVILPEDAFGSWLSEAAEPAKLVQSLGPYPHSAMEAFPVSPIVNSPKNNSPACLEPYAEPQQGELF